MIADADTKYGFGKNPPYSLYQTDNDKWGLIDGSGTKLEPAFTNKLLDPVMRNPDIDRDVKAAVWRAKVKLDYDILTYMDHFPEDM